MEAVSSPHRGLVELAGRPLLVCGHPKSGTSLLLSLLDGHPEILAFPEETKYFRAIHARPELRSAEALLAHTRLGRLGRERDGGTVSGRDLGRVDGAVFERELARLLEEERAPREVLPAVMLAYAAARGQSPTTYWAEKTPLHEHQLTTAVGLWPDLRAIYLLRDPRDVHASFLAKRRTRGRGLSLASSMWRMRASLRAWDAFAALYPGRALLIRYENLVLDAEATTRTVAGFLGVDWAESLTVPTLAGRPWSGNSMFGDVHAQVSVSPVGRYRDRLPHWKRRVLEWGLSREFRRFGWPRTPG